MPTTPTATDPVCGMTVDPATAAGSHEHDGTTHYFCSTHCRQKFRADPAKYFQIKAEPEHVCCSQHSNTPALQHSAAAVYTCPMHPEVRQPGPGVCPKCGMDLEPEAGAAGGTDDHPDSGRMTRRF